MIGRIVAARRSLRLPAPLLSGPSSPTWNLRGLPVCASTEWELDRWLATTMPPSKRLQRPRAVIARRQRHSFGQYGRSWLAPVGGVWLSAALPWPRRGGAAPGLAVASGLALAMEALGVPVRIKWPNDLLWRERKLAGLLPRLRWGQAGVRWARVGIGLNGCNRVPPGATNLLGPLGGRAAQPLWLCAVVLVALDWAMASAEDSEGVRELAEQRLLLPPTAMEPEGARWRARGLSADGGLVMVSGDRLRILHRHVDDGEPAGSA